MFSTEICETGLLQNTSGRLLLLSCYDHDLKIYILSAYYISLCYVFYLITFFAIFLRMIGIIFFRMCRENVSKIKGSTTIYGDLKNLIRNHMRFKIYPDKDYVFK